MKKIISLALFLLALAVPFAAQAGYKYANVMGEYIVELPDAPTGVTLWADKGRVPYLEKPPKYGAVGEKATFKRVDPETNESFEVNITFLKADRDFLLNLTQEVMEKTLKDEYGNVRLDDMKSAFSGGTGTIKIASVTGFSVTPENDLLFNAAYYLTGETSLQVIKVSFNADNKAFNQYYETLAQSINYVGVK